MWIFILLSVLLLVFTLDIHSEVNIMKKAIKIILSILPLVFVNTVFAETNIAGKIIFSSGINKVINSAGKSRVVKRGDKVNMGDLLQTNTGHMQIRFTDNGFVSIKPRSKLLIQKYQFNGKEDGNENAIFKLLKGSVRAITGLVGKTNKKTYQYRTPVATIGIRGTAFVLNYCNNDCFDDGGIALANGLYVNNGEGKIFVTSDGGTIDLIRGQFAYVADINSRPQPIRQAPNIVDILPDSIQQYDFDFRANENIVSNGEPIRPGEFIPPDLPINPIQTVNTNTKAFFANTGINASTLEAAANSNIYNDNAVASDITIDGDGNISAFNIGGVEFNSAQLNNGSALPQPITPQRTGSFATDGTNTDIVWGLWENTSLDGQEYRYQNSASNIYDNSDTSSGGGTGPMQFVYSDNITPDSVIQALQGTSTTITYGDAIGGTVSIATSPGSADFAEVTGVYVQQSQVPASITVDFGTGIVTDFQLRYTVDNNLTTSFSVNANGSQIGSADIADGVITTDQIFCSSLYCGGTGNSIQAGQVTANINLGFVGATGPDAIIGTVTAERPASAATGTPSASIASTFVVGQ